MVTVRQARQLAQNTCLFDFVGMGYDEKPVDTYESKIIANGSSFVEFETGDTYLYAQDKRAWYRRPSFAAGALTDEINAAILGGTW